jgi:hypothetical protein
MGIPNSPTTFEKADRRMICQLVRLPCTELSDTDPKLTNLSELHGLLDRIEVQQHSQCTGA